MSFSSDHCNRLIATRLKCVRLGSGSAANAESTPNDVVQHRKVFLKVIPDVVRLSYLRRPAFSKFFRSICGSEVRRSADLAVHGDGVGSGRVPELEIDRLSKNSEKKSLLFNRNRTARECRLPSAAVRTTLAFWNGFRRRKWLKRRCQMDSTITKTRSNPCHNRLHLPFRSLNLFESQNVSLAQVGFDQEVQWKVNRHPPKMVHQ